MKRCRLFTAAALPAALLIQGIGMSGEAAAQPPAQPRAAAARPAGQNPASEMRLPGPDGSDALAVTKTAPKQIRLGQEFEYQVTVKNVSDSPIQGVTVVEEHSGLKVQQAQAQNQNGQNQNGQNQNGQGQATQEGNTIRYAVGNLAAGESRTLSVNAVAEQKGRVTSCLRVEYNPTLCTAFEVVEPNFKIVATLLMDRDLVLQQDEKVSGVYRCDRLLLDVKVTSTGDASTAPATLNVDLPAGLTTEDGKEQARVEIGAIEPNKTVHKTMALKLDPEQAGQEIALTATATAGDLKAQAKLPTVQVLDPQLDLKIDGGGTQYIGREKAVKVTVSNPSRDPVLDARVQMTGLEGQRYNVDGADVDRSGVVTIGRLEPGASKTVNLTLRAAKAGNVAIAAKADGYCVQAVEKKATIEYKGIAAVLLEVIDQKDPVPVGENTVYEIKVKNQGSAVDNNIQLSAILPASQQFVEGRGESKVTADGQKVTFAKLDALGPGEVAGWTVTVKAGKADKAKFKVELTSDANQEPVIEQEPTTLY